LKKMEARKEKKAEKVADIETAIEKELMSRLHNGTYGDIYNFPMAQYQKALDKDSVPDEQEAEVDADGTPLQKVAEEAEEDDDSDDEVRISSCGRSLSCTHCSSHCSLSRRLSAHGKLLRRQGADTQHGMHRRSHATKACIAGHVREFEWLQDHVEYVEDLEESDEEDIEELAARLGTWEDAVEGSEGSEKDGGSESDSERSQGSTDASESEEEGSEGGTARSRQERAGPSNMRSRAPKRRPRDAQGGRAHKRGRAVELEFEQERETVRTRA
jgi:Mak16 protein C-terminal region